MSNVSIPDLVTKAIEQVRFDYVFNPEDSRCKCRYFFSLIHKDFITLSAQLDLINTTNMSFFDRPQQASILTLKATIQIRLGLFDEADKVCPRAACIMTVSSLLFIVVRGSYDAFRQACGDVGGVGCVFRLTICHFPRTALHGRGRFRGLNLQFALLRTYLSRKR